MRRAGTRSMTSEPATLPALDGLRAVAILLVMLFHAWYFLPGVKQLADARVDMSPVSRTQTGVQLFFVLSGFLLFLPYARWILGQKPMPDVLKFYRRRVLRVGPAFWTSLVILLLAGPFTLARFGHAALHSAFLMNAVPGSSWEFDSVYWTLAVEFQFYMVLPLIGWSAHLLTERLGVARGMLLLTVGATVLSATSAVVARHRQPLGPVMYGAVGHYSMSLWLAVFAAGMLSSVVFLQVRSRVRVSTVLRWAALPCLVTALVVSCALACVPAVRDLPLAGGDNALLFGWTYATILLAVLLGPSPLRRLFEWRLLRFVGVISYSLYIWHLVVYRHVAPHLSGLPSVTVQTLAGFLVELALCVPVAYVSYRVTERPFLGARRRAREVGEGAIAPPPIPAVTSRAS